MAIYEGMLGDTPFSVRRLSLADIEAVECVQKEVIDVLEDKQILQPLSREELQFLLGDHGVMVGAFVAGKLVAFRALLEPPMDAEHLGYDAGLTEHELPRVAYQEISVVHPNYRGHGLQRTLAHVVMQELDRTRFDFICATVMPFNIASIKDKFAQGMQVVALKFKYGGKLRYVFMKDLREHEEKQFSETTSIPMVDTKAQQDLLKEGWLGVRMFQKDGEWFVEYKKVGVNVRKIPVIIDTDPGIDDAMMLTFAFTREELDVRLVTTVAGNISQEKTNYNARAFLSYIGANVEVARGLDKPIFRELEVAEDIHGENGLGNVHLPAPTIPCSERPAVQAMVETLLSSSVPITIVATGPLTNIAALLVAHPEVKSKIKMISWMGGAAVGGNMSPTAEFNAYVDPHAVEMVFRSGIPIVMSGLDVTHKAYVTVKETERIAAIGTNFSDNMMKMLTFYLGVTKKTPFHTDNNASIIHFHDLCAIAYVVSPELFEGQDCYVEVSLEGKTAGTTIVDYMGISGKLPNVKVLHTVKREAFVEQFMQAVELVSTRI